MSLYAEATSFGIQGILKIRDTCCRSPPTLFHESPMRRALRPTPFPKDFIGFYVKTSPCFPTCPCGKNKAKKSSGTSVTWRGVVAQCFCHDYSLGTLLGIPKVDNLFNHLHLNRISVCWFSNFLFFKLPPKIVFMRYMPVSDNERR